MSTEVDDETILDVLRASDEPRVTTTEVAEELPITRGTTRSRLQRLADDGTIDRERSGNHVVWWLPERTDEDAADGEATADAEREGDEGDLNGTDAAADEPATAEPATDESATGTSVGSDESGSAGAADTSSEAEPESEFEFGSPAEESSPANESASTTEPTSAEGESTDVPVEAVPPDGTAVERQGEAERRPTPDSPAGGRDDEERFRAVALVAAALVVLLLLRRLLGGDTA